MPAHLKFQQITFFVILLLTCGLLLTEWFVAILAVLALAPTVGLSPSEGRCGLGSEPAIIVVCVFIMSGAFQQTRAQDPVRP